MTEPKKRVIFIGIRKSVFNKLYTISSQKFGYQLLISIIIKMTFGNFYTSGHNVQLCIIISNVRESQRFCWHNHKRIGPESVNPLCNEK